MYLFPFDFFLEYPKHNVLGDMMPNCVPLDEDMLPERLTAFGYKNTLLGKWHLGFCREECLPTSRGFHNFYGLWTGAQHHYTHMSGQPLPHPIMGLWVV